MIMVSSLSYSALAGVCKNSIREISGKDNAADGG
jgi:hypothetical protein